MAVDYLNDKFPSYVPTEDTLAKPFKQYFHKTGERFVRVIKVLDGHNPKSEGLYEQSYLHVREQRHNVDSYQINVIARVCNILANKLESFPVYNLERVLGDLDWSLNFNDSLWNELVGSIQMSDFSVGYRTNFLIANAAQHLVDMLARKLHDLNTVDGCKEIVDWLVTNLELSDSTNKILVDEKPTGNYYINGYRFDRKSIGNTSRINDVYTLANIWGTIDWRPSLMVFQNARDKVVELRDAQPTATISGYSMDDVVNMFEMFINKFELSARTMVHITRHTNAVEIVDANNLTCKTLTAPSVKVHDGVVYYRLVFSNQLVPGATYCNLVSYWDGSTEIVNQIDIGAPLAMFAHLNLPAYSGTDPDDITVPYVNTQSGEVWYTTVPFAGS